MSAVSRRDMIVSDKLGHRTGRESDSRLGEPLIPFAGRPPYARVDPRNRRQRTPRGRGNRRAARGRRLCAPGNAMLLTLYERGLITYGDLITKAQDPTSVLQKLEGGQKK